MAAEKGFHLQSDRLLQEEAATAILLVLLIVCAILLIGLAIVCVCRRRRGTQKVEFEVFTNENISSKDTKVEPTNVTNPITINEKQLNDISKEDSDTSNNQKRKRRRKKDRLTHNREALNEQKEGEGSSGFQGGNADELCIE